VNDTHKLVNDLSEQISRLVRDEFRLARLELTEKGRRAGLGAGLLGVAGMSAFFGAATLIAAVVMLLARVMPAWLSAVLVGVVLLLVAGLFALVGKKQVSKAAPLVPEETIASVKADIDVVKESARR
jgi:MFS family permease